MSEDVKLLPCPFCGELIRRVISKARSFNPPRDYIEWHHDAPTANCYIYNRTGPVIASTGDDSRAEADFIAAWNTRPPASRADRPNVAEVERLAEEWVDATFNHGRACGSGENDRTIYEYYTHRTDANTAFLTALRALGDAEWNRAKSMIAEALCEGCREKHPFHEETENFHVHPTHGRGFSCKAATVRSLRRGPAGG